jgi:HSP20 family protein
MRKEMDRVFDRFWGGDPAGLPAFGTWSPTLDVAVTADTVVVTAEIPGMDAENIHVSLQDEAILILKGEKKQEKEEKDERHYHAERPYGVFARSIRLPVAVDGSQAVATFKNGVLTVTLPKGPEAKGTTIPIKTE